MRSRTRRAIHRDVKPQNVLLNGDGRAKVTDFGIVRSLDAVGRPRPAPCSARATTSRPSRPAASASTPRPTSTRSASSSELLAGEVPYPGDNFLTVAMKHVNDPVPSVLDLRPDAPIRLATLIERSLAKDPADRPASMDEVVAELEAVQGAGREGGRRGDDDHAQAGGRSGPPAAAASPPHGREPRSRLAARPRCLLLAAVVGGILLLGRDDGAVIRRLRPESPSR